MSMTATFVGTGEAFDPDLPNTSIHIRTNSPDPASILLDCGFTAAHAYWRYVPDPQDLGHIHITHFHGDHFFGLPALLLAMWDEERTAPLGISGPEGVETAVMQCLRMSYGSLADNLAFPILFQEVDSSTTLTHNDCTLTFASSGHSKPCMAVRVSSPEGSVFYSGDGTATPETATLAKGANLIIHESYDLRPQVEGHGTVPSSITFAEQCDADALAIVHVRRTIRILSADRIASLLANASLMAIQPEPGQQLTIG